MQIFCSLSDHFLFAHYISCYFYYFCINIRMDAIRKIQFMVKGYRNFTKNEKPLPPLEGTLEGKNYVITGANSGIGFEAAKFAAQKKANVYLVCRNPQRGEQAVTQLKQLTKNENVYLILGDMGEKADLQEVYEKLKDKVSRVDILIHNAGCMLHERQFTKDGIEKNFATNTFSVYHLTKLCLPLLGENSRVIVTSSGGMYTEKLVTDDIYMEKEKFDGTSQYARNKRQQLCVMEELAKHHKGKGLFMSMHPGWVDTPALREAMPDFYQKMKNNLKEAPEGADTLNFLAIAPTEQLRNGEFYFEREIADKHLTISGTTYNQKEADLLMHRLHELSGI